MRTALRPALLTAVAAFALTALGAGGAWAHGGTLAVDIKGQQAGHVTAVVTWENDEDPVTERVAATVNAVSADGSRTAGPWMLVRDPAHPNSYTTAEALPPGTWKVTVEAGHPALGRDEADVTVAAASAPPAPAVHQRPASTAPAHTDETQTPTAAAGAGPVTVTLVGVALVAAAAAVFGAVRHRRGSSK